MIDDVFEYIVKPTHTSSFSNHPTAFPTVIPDPPIFEHITAAGSRTLWVVFVLMVIASISFIALSWRVPAAKRLYHSITTLIVIIATISYFAMATGSGVSWHRKILTEHHGDKLPDTHRVLHRQVFYARYIDWALTTPLLLLDLSLLAGLNGATIFSAVAADIIMILTGLFAAFASKKSTVWGWYAIACIAYLWIIYTLVFTGRTSAKARGNNASRFYNSIALYTLVLWTLYPIVWGLADGSRIISVNGEVIAYAVLDVLAKGVFGAWLLFTHARLPESHADIGGFWANGLNNEGSIRIGDDDGA